MSNLNIKGLTLSEVAEIALPYVEGYSRSVLLSEIAKNPGLEKEYQEQLSESFIQRVNDIGNIYFITNAVSWKLPKHMNKTFTSHVRISYCGQERLPTISVGY